MSTVDNPKSKSSLLAAKVLVMVGALFALNAHAPIPCAATGDCRAVGVVPVCANVQTAFCNTSATPDECSYALRNTGGCPCIEGDVRECTMSNGKSGISDCVAVTATTTQWGACGAL
jgi:hypothetical protein